MVPVVISSINYTLALNKQLLTGSLLLGQLLYLAFQFVLRIKQENANEVLSRVLG